MLIGDETEAQSLSKYLFEQGFLVSSFAFPVVPKTKARIRFQVSALHTEEELKSLATVLSRRPIANTKSTSQQTISSDALTL